MGNIIRKAHPVVIEDGINLSLSNIDVFNRNQTALPFNVVEWTGYRSGQIARGEMFDSRNVGGGTTTHNSTSKSYELATTVASGDVAQIMSNEWYRYQPGNGQEVKITFDASTPQADLIQDVGLFDDFDGVGFRVNGTGKEFFINSSVTGSVVPTIITQANWNVDKLDGSGESGKTIDLENTQLFYMQYSFLGVGEVRYGFQIDGEFVIAHIHRHSNNEVQKYMRSGTLPISVKVTNNAAISSASTFEIHCFNVASLGGGDFKQIQARPNVASFTNVTVGVTEIGVLAIRQALNYDGEVNRTISIPLVINVLSDNKSLKSAVYMNPTVTGGTWTAIPGSSMEVNTTFTGFTGGAERLAPLFGINVSQVIPESFLRDLTIKNDAFATVAGDGDVFLLALQSLAANTTTNGSVAWREFYR